MRTQATQTEITAYHLSGALGGSSTPRQQPPMGQRPAQQQPGRSGAAPSPPAASSAAQQPPVRPASRGLSAAGQPRRPTDDSAEPPEGAPPKQKRASSGELAPCERGALFAAHELEGRSRPGGPAEAEERLELELEEEEEKVGANLQASLLSSSSGSNSSCESLVGHDSALADTLHCELRLSLAERARVAAPKERPPASTKGGRTTVARGAAEIEPPRDFKDARAAPHQARSPPGQVAPQEPGQQAPEAAAAPAGMNMNLGQRVAADEQRRQIERGLDGQARRPSAGGAPPPANYNGPNELKGGPAALPDKRPAGRGRPLGAASPPSPASLSEASSQTDHSLASARMLDRIVQALEGEQKRELARQPTALDRQTSGAQQRDISHRGDQPQHQQQQPQETAHPPSSPPPPPPEREQLNQDEPRRPDDSRRATISARQPTPPKAAPTASSPPHTSLARRQSSCGGADTPTRSSGRRRASEAERARTASGPQTEAGPGAGSACALEGLSPAGQLGGGATPGGQSASERRRDDFLSRGAHSDTFELMNTTVEELEVETTGDEGAGQAREQRRSLEDAPELEGGATAGAQLAPLAERAPVCPAGELAGRRACTSTVNTRHHSYCGAATAPIQSSPGAPLAGASAGAREQSLPPRGAPKAASEDRGAADEQRRAWSRAEPRKSAARSAEAPPMAARPLETGAGEAALGLAERESAELAESESAELAESESPKLAESESAKLAESESGELAGRESVPSGEAAPAEAANGARRQAISGPEGRAPAAFMGGPADEDGRAAGEPEIGSEAASEAGEAKLRHEGADLASRQARPEEADARPPLGVAKRAVGGSPASNSPPTTLSELDQDEELSTPSFVDNYKRRLEDQVYKFADEVATDLLSEQLAADRAGSGAAGGRPSELEGQSSGESKQRVASSSGSSGSSGSSTSGSSESNSSSSVSTATASSASSSTTSTGGVYECASGGRPARRAAAKPPPAKKPAHLAAQLAARCAQPEAAVGADLGSGATSATMGATLSSGAPQATPQDERRAAAAAVAATSVGVAAAAARSLGGAGSEVAAASQPSTVSDDIQVSICCVRLVCVSSFESCH